MARESERTLVGLVAHGGLPTAPATVVEVDAAAGRSAEFLELIGRLAVDQAAESGVRFEIVHQYGPAARVLRRMLVGNAFELVVIGRSPGWIGGLCTLWTVRVVRCSVLIVD
jgi:hypothetical protein